MSRSVFVDIEAPKLRLHALEAGQGEAVLMVHGWPTSSHLWRNIVDPVAAGGFRALALDLPGFGRSDKPAGDSYSFNYQDRAIEAALDGLGVEKVNLVVHDLGGPVGLYWAHRHPERVSRIALLNTVVYPELSWAARLFLLGVRVPLARDLAASPWGLRQAMRLGVEHKERLTPAVMAGYLDPFKESSARTALLRTASRLHVDGIRSLARWLPSFKGPLHIIYGENDRILPDVAETMARVVAESPHARKTSLPGCGHFLQEDEPEEIARLLLEWLAEPLAPARP